MNFIESLEGKNEKERGIDEIDDGVINAKNGHDKAENTLAFIQSKFEDYFDINEMQSQINAKKLAILNEGLGELPDDPDIRNYYLFATGHPELAENKQMTKSEHDDALDLILG